MFYRIYTLISLRACAAGTSTHNSQAHGLEEIKISTQNLDVLPPVAWSVTQRVKIRNLSRRVQYNGLCGVVMSGVWDDEDRVLVGLDAGGQITVSMCVCVCMCVFVCVCVNIYIYI
jgi:hypothetical protein